MTVVEGPDVFGDSPEIGIPDGVKPGGNRVDFRDELFDTVIENKGLRMAWSQQTVCPCVGINRQTDQPDPDCEGCGGAGYLYFRPATYAPPDDAGQLTPLHQYIIDRTDSPAVVVRALQFGHERKENTFDRIGTWVEGSATITVRKNHKLQYYDRLTYLDAVLPFSEFVIAPAPSEAAFKLRFPAVRVDLLIDSSLNRYEPDEDFTCDNQGRIKFLAGKGPTGTNVPFSVRYLHHPQFLVMSHMNGIRMAVELQKITKQNLTTPVGNPQDLPIRVMAQLEYLAGLGNQGSTP
jgi:hypothetical protein